MRIKLLFFAASLFVFFNVKAQGPALTISHSNVSCFGESDGSATANATGGIPPYTYSWSNGATTKTISNLAAGLYTCTVTALGGNTAQASVLITQPPALNYTSSKTDVVCFGKATGSATVTVSGGTPPYTYSWVPSGGTNATANNLTAGIYRCIITDANGCDALAVFNIADGTPITFTKTQTSVLCKGQSNGSATVNVTGGGGPFTYNWLPSGGTGATASNLAAGTYTCTITNNAGCDTTTTVTITEPAAVLNATATKKDVLCFGAATGSATVAVTGGTSPYTYSWSPSGGTGVTANNLTAGTYTCTVTDARGCTTTATATIAQPSAALSTTTTQTDVLCFGATTGSATVTVSGGTTPYTYSWSSGGGTAATASNLAAGTYTCTITDANGCKTSATVNITQATQLAATTTQTNVLCNGGNTGSATVTASGGVGPYTYSWSPSGGTGATANNLTAGSYTCTITDANGCTKTASVTITEPTALSFTTSQTNVLCFGSATGIATATVSGGTAPYTYSWSPGGGTAATAKDLPAGTYTCTITDANNCNITATVTITENPQITFTTTQTNVACNGGNAASATVNVSGGTAPYSYSWSPSGGIAATANGLSAGVYTCTIIDANGCDTTAKVTITQPPALSATATKSNISCNGANDGTATAVVSGGVAPYTYSWTPGGATTATINNLGPGTYTCTATDANGCTITGTVSLVEPTLLVAASSASRVSCNGGNDGSVTASASGGTPPYTYSWSPGGATTETVENLVAGTYTCTITDANGCTATTSSTVSQPSPLTGSTSHTNVTCNGLANGTATANASGGTAPYTYAWSNGGTTQTINNLAPGDYTVNITDANGCTFNVTTPATVTEPPALSASTTHTDIGCNGENTGTATAAVTGGTAPYTYSWSPSGGTGPKATGLGVGTYTCNITDANGCTTSTTATIAQSTSLNAIFSATDVSCKGAADGSATAAPSGGAAPYSYSWAPGGQTTPTISNLGPGTYTCTVTDANGCNTKQTVEVKEPALLTARDTIISNVTCNGASDAIAKVTPAGGTAPYTYSWSPGGGTSQTMSNLAAGTYTTTVTDANGCTATSSVTVTQPTALDGYISSSNVTSPGANNGSATAHGTGGTPPYTYNWNNGDATTQTITNLPPGTYPVEITDANGCTVTRSVTITDATGDLGANTNQTNVSCFGAADGTASVSAYGGTGGPYTYLWAPGGATTASITGLAPGTYTCTISDGVNTPIDVSVTITQPAELTASATGTDATCNGGNTGSAIVVAAGGTAPYAYSWSNGATNDTIISLTAGTYTCTVTDANNCSTTATVTIGEPAALTATSTQTNTRCNGSNDGIATANVTGGTAPYTYSWSPSGGGGQSATGLAPGTYTCTITDMNNCTTTVDVTITEPDALTAGANKANVSCNGAADGTATAIITGGTTPYTYAWDPDGQTGVTITNLGPGTYTAHVTDANGCKIIGTVEVTQPATLTATTTHVNTTCNGDTDGSATVNPAGGTAPYTYSWSTTATTQTITALAPGTYTCLVTDANSCTTNVSVTISEPAVVSANISKVDVVCNGATTGSITLSGTGGTGPYTYLWQGGETTATISTLAAGTYTCTITDSHSCTGVVTVTINQPLAITGTVSQTNVSCKGNLDGTATLAVTGGVPPYTYNWSPSGGTGAIATGLGAGVYTCTITDFKGCSGVATVTITEPDSLKVDVNLVNVTCKNAGDGTVTLTPSGGTPPYTYTWSTGGTTETATNLTPGTHQFSVTDANNCSVNQSFTITEPNALTATSSHTNVGCFNGSDGTATAVPAEGTAPYTYLWSPGGATTATATGLTAGTYTCTVTDANGCTTTTSTTVTQPTKLSASITQGNVSCNGAGDGTAGVTASGGTAPYTYLWSNSATTAAVSGLVPGTYSCAITDANGCDTTVNLTITEPDALSFTTAQTNILCNGSATGSATVTVSGGTVPYTYNWSPSGGTGATAVGLTAGTYTCTITDTHGCDTTATVTLTEPTALSFTTAQTDVDCNGNSTGSATVTVSGGVGPYTYSWSSGGGTAATANNLSAGTYTCDITDSNGCSTTATVAITEPDVLSATTSQVDVNCKDGNTGSATVTPHGGTSPYTYLWADGRTTATINNLTAGTYSVTITDAHNCTTSTTVTITENAALAVAVTQNNVLCNGTNTGSISLVTTGGTAPYTYSWNNGETTAAIDNLAVGTYTATITDVNGCDTSISVTLTEPATLTFTTSQVDVNCNGGNTGSATVTPGGGTGPYSYYWTNGATTATISNLTAGTYYCTVSDSHGCDTTATFTITETAAVMAIPTPTDVLCNGGSTGSISLAPTGGTAPYTYLWNNGATTATINNLTAGTYTCTITDANGCTGAAIATITEPAALSFTTSQANVNCNGGNTGSATVIVAGGTSPYSYLWSNGNTTATANTLTAGTYTCTITDAHGCDTTATVTITETAAITASVTQNDVLCNGGNTGSISIVASGGTAPYRYLWNNGATTATINNLTAGTYICVVTDTNNCRGTVSVTIAEPAVLSFTTSQVNVNCNGGNTGSATVTATGGTLPYSYVWSTGATTATANNLTAGVYTCTISDAHGCDTTATVTITETAALAPVVTQNDVLCNGGNTGSISVATTGGTAPYSYAWSNGATTAAVNNLIAGTYTATITDVNGCDTTISVTITEPVVLGFTTSQVNINCNGGNTGSATVTASGGTSPYSYLWSNGATTATINNLTAGTYTCTITDAHGCDTTASFFVRQSAPIAGATTQHDVLCNGGNTGSIAMATTGGTAPYTYLWSNGATTESINNLVAGTYTCTITDMNGCTGTVSVTITEPDVLGFTTSQVNVNCNGGSTGSATVTPTGGTSPYSYLWSNGATTATISNLTAGTYTCTITDAHGCDTTASFFVRQSPPIAGATTQHDVLCNGGNTGSIAMATTGGTAPYTYLWSNGATTESINNLVAGTYTCTITDMNGCTGTVSVTITEPDVLGFTTSQVNINCNGGNTGSATVTPAGGTSPYSYLWSNGATTASINNLTAGTYTCTITDAHGCDTTASFFVRQSAPIAGATTQHDVLCNGGNTGSIAMATTGGTAPYTYLWSNGATTESINNLVAGTYTCTITDMNGCTGTVSVTITEPDVLSFTTSQVNVNCNGGSTGSATVTPAGGTSPYSYLWSNGATTATINNLTAGTYTCTITDAHGCDTTASFFVRQSAPIAGATTQHDVLCHGDNTGSIAMATTGGTAPYTYLWSNGATTESINNLVAGTYTCTITDMNGCTGTVSVTITEPDVLGFTTSQVNVNCNGGNTGSATVTATGGTAPYAYLWSNGATTTTISNLAAGTYTCTITDAHGCDTTASFFVRQSAPVAGATTQHDVLCHGGNIGSIAMATTGGTAPYTYLWSNGATTESINNLTAGTYTCTITDMNGCTGTVSVTITEPDVLSFTTSQVNVNCNGSNTGSATVTVAGGTSPYSYLWSNGATTATANNLTAGTYTVTIGDAHGCDTTATFTITEKAAITTTVTHDDVLCNGGNTGSITVAVAGGTAPYTYLWNNGATTATINNLTAGVYTATITDANGCDTAISVTVTEPAVLSFTTSQVNVNCNGGNTGSATVTASGGTSPYSYLWSNSATTATVNSLKAGTYTCTITDAHGCDTTATFTITETAPVTAAVTQQDVLCNGGNTGSITVTTTGGTAPYSYAWSNGATTAAINNLTAGTYTATIKDVNGCDTTISVTITEPVALSFTTSQVNVNCNGGNTGSATVTVAGGTSPYSYLWSNGATTATINNLAAGAYTCTITDAHGCDTTATVTITATSAIIATVTHDNVLCNGGNTGSIAVAATGGTAPYTYLWSNGATTATINNLAAGTYTATITDANGCNTTVSATVTEPAVLTFTTTQTNVVCGDGNTGSASVVASGGTAPYTYLWSNGASTATISNLAAGTYSCTITDANGCKAEATVIIVSGNFEATKTVTDESGNGTVEENELLTYTIRIKNTGVVTINNITITDPVPEGSTFVSSTQGTLNNNVVSFTDVNLAANEERVYQFIVRTDQNLQNVTRIVNTAEVTGSANGTSCTQNPTVTIPVLRDVNLGVVKQTDNKPITVPDRYNYTITITNRGSTARTVTVTDTLPTGITYISNTVSRGVADYDAGSRILTWRLDSLEDEGNAVLTLTVQADVMGTIVNTATVSSPQVDIDETNNRSSVDKEVIPFKIPNVFTPNGNGSNDKFVIKGLELYSENELLVFNRWNANVYQQKNYQNDWDGSGLNEGTYFYILKLKDSNNVWHTYKGNVLILRR